jgi:hypothetical protein
MRSVQKVLAVVGLVGLGVGASSAVAVPNQLDSLEIAHQDPMLTVLAIGAPVELAGAPCMILEGPAFGVGMPVGATVLVPGPNLLVVPNLPGPSWYTAIGPFEPKGVEDQNDAGAN